MAKPKEKELGGARSMSKGAKILVVVFAVLMALSMMLPSLAPIFAGSSVADEGTTEQADTATDDESTKDNAKEEAKDEKAEETKDKDAKDGDKAEGAKKDKASDKVVGEENIPDNETLKSSAETNVEKVKKYLARLDEDENNLAALLNLGQTYMSWGYSAYSSSTTDEEKAYSKTLLDTAIEYFDRYLKLNDSATVKINRAIAQHYGGETEAAIEALKKVCEEYPENPLAQAQLAYLFESQFKNDEATAAYRKAVELDADDAYGVKSYANQRIIALNAKIDSVGDPGDAGVKSSDTADTGDTDGQSELLKKLNGDNLGF